MYFILNDPMSQKSLYYKTQFETKISLSPSQIDHQIDEHILNNLKQKINGKVIDNGIVIRILRLLDYDYGIIDKASSNGSTIYRVKYECLYCSPIKDMEIIGRMQKIVKGYASCANGPIVAVIELSKNNESSAFKITETEIKHSSGKVIKEGDYLKLSVISSPDNIENMQLAVMCKLVNIASEAEIKNFMADDEYINQTQSAADAKTFI